MSYPLPLTRTEAYLAYKAGVIQQSELKPSLAVPRIGIDAWLAYWTQLANDYPKNLDGTPKILQEEEAYVAYLCGVIDTYPEKCLRRVGAYLRYLISARWGRPDHPLNREELYLSLIKTQVVPSGDPSSDIVIDGTTKAPFVDVKVYGDTFQQTYEGKNLLGLETPPGTFTYGLDVAVAEESGTITVDGTYAGGGGGFPWISDRQLNIPAGTYTFSMKNPQSFNVSLRMFDAQGQYTGGKYIAAGATSGTFTLEYDCVRVAILIGGFNAGATFDNQKIEGLQLEAGSTATSFEPYVGGVPSPNPDYPQPIRTVTGTQTVEIQGKNWANLYRAFPFTANGVTVTKENDGSITLNGVLSSNTNITISQNNREQLDYLNGKTVTMSFITTGTGSFSNIGIKRDGSDIFTSVSSPKTGVLDFGTKTQSNWQVWCIAGTTYNNFNIKLQLELGSTATDYAPYSKQAYTIDLGDIELCKLGSYQDYIYKDGDDWKVHKDIGKYQFNGSEPWVRSGSTTSDVFVAVIASTLQDYLKVKDRTTFRSPYFIQHNPVSTASGQMDAYNGPATAPISFALSFESTSITNITDATTWISNNKPTVYSAINDPTDTVITNQALIDQLNALKQGGAEEGTTYIRVSATDPNLPAKLYVEAPKYD